MERRQISNSCLLFNKLGINNLLPFLLMNLIQFKDELAGRLIVTFKLDTETNAKLNQIATEVGISKSAVIRTLIKYGIQTLNKQYKQINTSKQCKN
jgi:predicted DNA-binding protein